MTKIDWEKKAEKIFSKLHYSSDYKRLARVLKAETRYRRLMKTLKECSCPYELWRTTKNYSKYSCGSCRCRKDKNKYRDKCWRRFVRTELDGE